MWPYTLPLILELGCSRTEARSGTDKNGYWGATGQKSSIRATEGQNRVKKTHFSTHRS